MANVKVVFTNNEELNISDTSVLVGISKNNPQSGGWISSSQFVGIQASASQISHSREFAEFCLNCDYFYLKDDIFVDDSDVLKGPLYSVSSIHKIIDIN